MLLPYNNKVQIHTKYSGTHKVDQSNVGITLTVLKNESLAELTWWTIEGEKSSLGQAKIYSQADNDLIIKGLREAWQKLFFSNYFLDEHTEKNQT